MLEIRLLGQYDLRQDGTPIEVASRPARTLLAYLVLTPGTHHPRLQLAGLLWPDSSESNARKNLRQALWHLRKTIGDDHLLVDRVSIALDSNSDYWFDADLLEDPAERDLEEAVSVYEGELLPGFYEEWVLLERDRLDAVYERKMQRLLAELLQEERWEDVLNWGERWIARGHVPEAAYRALMVAHASAGELSKVDSTYQRCAQALQREIGVDPSQETTRLYETLMAGEIAPGLPAVEVPEAIGPATVRQVNLPAQPTDFIGREQELSEIERLLSESRLLTLIGPGGMGKTRLALMAASEMVDTFDHGCTFVSLAPIPAVDYLVQTIAEALSYPLATHEDPQTQLLRYLQNRQLLLVMDNFEHLLDGVGIISEILQSAPGVKILATSREKLNLQSETRYIVEGMCFSIDEGSEDLSHLDSVSLFVQSANKVRPGFDPSPKELEQITNICSIVGGMPLAIELAAAWLHILSVDEIVEELGKGLDLLVTEMRDVPERHRSIRAVFDHSWAFLSSTEQKIIMQLSVFSGGCTREAAQQVSGATLQQLAGLVSKSFLSLDPVADRFVIHELLCQYAQERLGETAGAITSAQDAHAAYYAAFMQQMGEHLRGKRHLLVLAEIEADIENVRAAWRFYLNQGDTPQLWKFITSLWHVYWIRWWNYAGMELFAEAVDLLQEKDDDDSVALCALAMAFQAYFMTWLGLAEEGYTLAEQAVEVLEKHDRPEALVFAYDSLAVNAYFLGRMAEEIEAINKMLAIATEMDDQWLLAFTLFAAGMAALLEGDYDEARRLATWNLALYEEIGDVSGSTMPLIVLGHSALACGEYQQAREYYLRCLELSEEIDFHYSIQTSSKYLAQVALSTGNTAEAETYLDQCLAITKDIGFVRDIVNLLYEFARLRAAQEHPEQAVELLALVLEHPASDQIRWLEGRISDSAQSLLADLEGELDVETYAAALERGRELELDAVVSGLLQMGDA